MADLLLFVFIVLVAVFIVIFLIWVREFNELRRRSKLLDKEIERKSRYNLFYSDPSGVYGVKDGSVMKLSDEEITFSTRTFSKSERSK